MNISAQVTPLGSRSEQARERLAIQRLARAGGKPSPVGHSAIKPALIRALTTGGATRTGPLTVNWDVAGTGKYRCLSPAKRSIEATQGVDDKAILKHRDRPHSWLDMTMRCRRCAHCMQLRALTWSTRAKAEIEFAQRTWFGTMTLKPSQHLRCEQYARAALGRSGGDWDQLTESEQFAERHKIISMWLTLWVKRIRKAGEGSLRLMVVCEKHQSGLPHYHCLVHELVAFATNERELRHQWFYGFSKFVLVNMGETGKAAWYMAKYLAKDTSARVRASVSYGTPHNALSKVFPPKNVHPPKTKPPTAKDQGGITDQEGQGNGITIYSRVAASGQQPVQGLSVARTGI